MFNNMRASIQPVDREQLSRTGGFKGGIGGHRATQPPQPPRQQPGQQRGGFAQSPGHQPPPSMVPPGQKRGGFGGAVGGFMGGYGAMHQALGMEGTPASGLGGALGALGSVLFNRGGGTPGGRGERTMTPHRMR